jgi:hypothetical protein
VTYPDGKPPKWVKVTKGSLHQTGRKLKPFVSR